MGCDARHTTLRVGLRINIQAFEKVHVVRVDRLCRPSPPCLAGVSVALMHEHPRILEVENPLTYAEELPEYLRAIQAK